MTLGEFLASWVCAGERITISLYCNDDVITMYKNIKAGSLKVDPSLGLNVCGVSVNDDDCLEILLDNTI